MKKLIAFGIGMLLCLALSAQDTSYTLLWYKGRKLKPGVLLTPAKDTVRFDRTKSILKVNHTTGKGEELEKMLAELNRTPQRMNEMMNKMKAGLPKTVVPYYAGIIKESFTQVQKEFTPCLANTMVLPSPSFAKAAAKSTTHGPSGDEQIDGPTFNEAMEQVESYYQQHKNEKITWVPTPPRREFTYCNLTDKAAVVNYERDFELFRKELMAKDAEIFDLCLKLFYYAEVMEDDAGREVIYKKLNPVVEMIHNRTYRKGELVLEQFVNDPYRAWSVFKIELMIERHLALIGWLEENNKPSLANITLQKSMAVWAAMFEKAMQEYDYTVALNMQAALSLERMAQMHDLDVKIPLGKLLKFNRFKMNMHVSSKISVEGGYQLAELKGDNWFSALPDSTGRLTWVLIGPLVNKISMDLTAAEFRGKIDFPYAGTRKWESQLPKMRIDFCDKEKDTLDIYMFYAQGHKETWIFPAPTGAQDILIVSGLMGNTFLDVNRIRETKNEFKNNPEAIEKLKKDMMARLEKMKQSGSMASMPAGQDASLNQLAWQAEMQRRMNEMRQGNQQYDPFKFVFKPTPHNRTPVILQEKINGKELFPQNTATEYAWFHLKLEQDPNCPYEVTY